MGEDRGVLSQQGHFQRWSGRSIAALGRCTCTLTPSHPRVCTGCGAAGAALTAGCLLCLLSTLPLTHPRVQSVMPLEVVLFTVPAVDKLVTLLGIAWFKKVTLEKQVGGGAGGAGKGKGAWQVMMSWEAGAHGQLHMPHCHSACNPNASTPPASSAAKPRGPCSTGGELFLLNARHWLPHSRAQATLEERAQQLRQLVERLHWGEGELACCLSPTSAAMVLQVRWGRGQGASAPPVNLLPVQCVRCHDV